MIPRRFVDEKALRGPIQFYESEYALLPTVPREHPSKKAIRVHEARKLTPGYANRGARTYWTRWFMAELKKIYRGSHERH